MPCHYHGIKDLYMAHTFTTGGMALKWFRDAFCELEILLSGKTGLDSYYLLEQEVKQVPPGSDGMIMLPHLQGAMAPEANPKAKGVYFGITMKHTKAHFIRAIMEGVGFIVMRNIEVIESMGIPVEEIRVLGGGSKSNCWNQIKADITGRVIWTTDNSDAACLGAAIISGVSCGLFPNVKEAVSKMVNLKQKFEPNMKNHHIYRKLFEQYKQLYTALIPLFELSKQQEGE
jgi:xylulokinase